jgi:hypothetical protein
MHRDLALPSVAADSRLRRLLMAGPSQAILIQDKENSGALQQEGVAFVLDERREKWRRRHRKS